MNFLKYRLLFFTVFFCIVPMMTYAWTQSFFYESATPKAPVIDVKVVFMVYDERTYARYFNGLYAGTGGIAKISGKAADCLVSIAIANTGSANWRKFPDLKVMGNAWEKYINRCGNNKFKIQRELNGSYKLYKDFNTGYVAQSGEIKI